MDNLRMVNGDELLIPFTPITKQPFKANSKSFYSYYLLPTQVVHIKIRNKEHEFQRQ